MKHYTGPDAIEGRGHGNRGVARDLAPPAHDIDLPLAGWLAMPHVVVRRTLDEHRSIAMTTLEDRASMHSTHRFDCVT